MQKVVGVSVNSGKVEFYLSQKNTYNINDTVVVETSGALAIGKVVVAQKQIDPKELSEPLSEVVRLATIEDLKKHKENLTKNKEAAKLTKKFVKDLKLDMKIVDAMYSLDSSKVIIEFTAEDRVDFRELLKVLASNLKARIELKQIGQRDEVKIKGGIGPCGEICCCKRFLNDFEHVTVKMAKNQGLSLSPTKISGLCGRLMCCLGYENPTYEEILKQMPKINSAVSTPDGEGTCVYNDILRKLVSVKFTKGDDTSEIVVYPLENIKLIYKEKNNGVQNKPKKMH